MPQKLSTYHAKRNFRITDEPRGRVETSYDEHRFVVQRHEASKLHYDFRLELDGALKSWAVPKGPSLDPAEKRLAVQVEDHPVAYASFEGVIPENQYGAGRVSIWDSGHWEPVGDPLKGYEAGKLKFRLHGGKLQGGWNLIRTRLRDSTSKPQWLLIKENDEAARSGNSAEQEADSPKRTRCSRLQASATGNMASVKTKSTSAISQLGNAAPTRSRSTARTGKEVAAGEKVQGVLITNPGRIIDPPEGATKLDLAHYYEAVAPFLLTYLKLRPVYLLRAPQGLAGGKSFFQRHAARTAIPGITILDPAVDPEHEPLMVIDSVQALISAVQMGTIEFHLCNARADQFGRPDSMVFDLDPDPTLPFEKVIEGSQVIRRFLEELGLKCFVKTSGSKGLHVMVPLVRRHQWEEVTEFCKAVTQHLANTFPEKFSATMGQEHRRCEIFIDYLRNQQMASTVAPYSVRAKKGMPVSVPIDWSELEDPKAITASSMWNIFSLQKRLKKQKRDPWEDFGKSRQVITKNIRKKLKLGEK